MLTFTPHSAQKHIRFTHFAERGEGMSKRKYSEVEMIGALKQMEAGRNAADVGRELGVSKHTIYAWKAKYGGMSVGEAQRLRQLEDENGRRSWWRTSARTRRC